MCVPGSVKDDCIVTTCESTPTHACLEVVVLCTCAALVEQCLTYPVRAWAWTYPVRTYYTQFIQCISIYDSGKACSAWTKPSVRLVSVSNLIATQLDSVGSHYITKLSRDFTVWFEIVLTNVHYNLLQLKSWTNKIRKSLILCNKCWPLYKTRNQHPYQWSKLWQTRCDICTKLQESKN